MTLKHIIGMFSLVVCALAVSLSGIIEGMDTEETEYMEGLFGSRIGAWIPVMVAVMTPIGFALNAMLVKYLTTERNMDPSVLSYGSFTLVNFVILIIAIIYWSTNEFDTRLFLIGLFGSFFNTLGIVCAMLSVTKGPAGPATALRYVSTIMLTVEEAIRF